MANLSRGAISLSLTVNIAFSIKPLIKPMLLNLVTNTILRVKNRAMHRWLSGYDGQVILQFSVKHEQQAKKDNRGVGP